MSKSKALHTGMKVKMLDGDEVIDEGVVCRVDPDDHGRKKIRVKSTRTYPGQFTDFALVAYGNMTPKWCMLFEDPFSGGLCYSQRGPSYDFVPA